MKTTKISVLIVTAIAILSCFGCSEDWLEKNPGIINPADGIWEPLISAINLNAIKDFEQVVVVDVRAQEEYLEGHVPGSINIPILMPSSGWIVSDELLMELPPLDDLEDMLSEAGISNDSKIVLISGNTLAPEPPYVLANVTRVLATLHYVGIKDVAILNGGINRWVEEGFALETEPSELPATSFIADPNLGLFVSTEYVEASIGSKIIIDTRDAEVYSGEVIEPWASKAGHIPTAVSMPVVDVWNEDDTYKSIRELKELFEAAVGNGVSKHCKIRRHPDTRSGIIRAGIPVISGHAFWNYPDS
ncbi:sulfurtransferase [Natronoflexus pectinivorans]|uniref:Thiosulfate/3-mercaptopyruvate sulfurtransferase n=1 Tax=Natronoflexus pectinivorans TaxID=682526 RepID=A0A4R2GP39_9BACT|nr:rhodanese-like domain-containing protein [Natronoflexus pectinivorans]TCO11105.1 thiosulfate/3-mercaptopyruvate sulfurtransferase [Natronoflexus pectinivorans]